MSDLFKEKYIEARRKVISEDFAFLNEKQREAVMATEGPLLILAGAGSGKTTVLINRIANLLKYGKSSDTELMPEDASEDDIITMNKGGEEAQKSAAYLPVAPWRILAITFTNKAADELKNRLASSLGDKANDIWACTFHSACVRILRRDAERLGFESSFTIYDTNDSVSLIKQILKQLNLDDKTFPPKSVLSEISRAKDSKITAKAYSERASMIRDIRKIRIGEIYTRYSEELFRSNAMDFDDLLLFTVKLFEDNPDVLEYWQNRFEYVLIDEYQDTNRLQYNFARLISGKFNNLCVVGDDDQSIYKFRGADIENILTFEDNYETCRTIRLEQNYRSTSHILDAANNVIRNNIGRKGKELWTNKDPGDPVELYSADNENDEARFVASTIISDMDSGASFKDHAILYRMNAQSNALEYALKRNGIPYRVFGGTKFFERAEIKDVISYLCVVASPSDDLRLQRIINVPARGIGRSSLDKALQAASDEGLTLFEVLKNADKYPELSRASYRMREFTAMIEGLRDSVKTQGLDEFLDTLLEKTGYLKMYEQSGSPEDESRVENIKELKSNIINYMAEAEEPSLPGFLADVALYTDLDSYNEDNDCVVMMTMHSAKGLEFPTVFIVGAEESIFPSIRSIGDPDEMEEERRLCYVAITRAKKKLYITAAKQRMLFGRTTNNKISRFVDEIPEEHIVRRNVTRGYSYSDKAWDRNHSYEPDYGEPDSKRPIIKTGPVKSTYRITLQKPQASKPVSDFKTGDRVKHRAFGEGVISKMTPMGGDYLIEIDFGGTVKKLMLKAAVNFMEKL